MKSGDPTGRRASTPPPARLKAACNRAHARRRAAERYSINWTAAQVAEVEATIRAGGTADCVPIRPDHWNRERQLWAVKQEGRWLPVLYDGATASLLSVLPERALDPYRSGLERPAPAAAAPAATILYRPAAPSPELARPPVGTVVGFVPLPPRPVALSLDALPPIPDLPPDPTIAEADAVKAAVRARLAAVNVALNSRGDMGKRDRTAFEAERDRLAARFAELKREAHAAHLRLTDCEGAPILPHDPVALLEAARSIFKTMGARLNWELTEREVAVGQAVQNYLVVHAKMRPPAAPGDAEVASAG